MKTGPSVEIQNLTNFRKRMESQEGYLRHVHPTKTASANEKNRPLLNKERDMLIETG